MVEPTVLEKGNRGLQFGIAAILYATLGSAAFFALARATGVFPAMVLTWAIATLSLFTLGIVRLDLKWVLLGLVTMMGPLAWLCAGAIWYAHCQSKRQREAPAEHS